MGVCDYCKFVVLMVKVVLFRWVGIYNKIKKLLKDGKVKMSVKKWWIGSGVCIK